MSSSLISKYREMPVRAKAALWFFLSRLLQKGISVLTTPIFTRLLSTSDYGLWTNFNSWFEILSLFITLRLSYGVYVQGLVKYPDDRDNFTSSLVGLTTLLSVCALIIYVSGHAFWDSLTSLDLFTTLMIIISAWATEIFSFWTARQRVELRYRSLMFVTVGSALAKPLAGIAAVLAFPSARVEARIASMVAVEVICYMGMFILFFYRSKRFYIKQYWEQALKFNIPLVPHYLSRTVLSQFDRIMIARMVSMSAAGIYGLAYSLSWLMSMVNQSVHSTFEPWIYECIKEDEVDRIPQTSYFLIILVAFSNLALIAAAPELIQIFAPPAYYEAIWVIPPLAGSVFLTFMYNLFACFEFYFEYTSYVTIASLASGLLNVVLNLIFIPLFGYIAAGYTTLLGYGLNIGLHYMFMRRVQRREMNGTRVYSSKILLMLIAGFAACAALLTVLYPYPLARWILLCVALVGIFVNRDRFINLLKQMRKKHNTQQTVN